MTLQTINDDVLNRIIINSIFLCIWIYYEEDASSMFSQGFVCLEGNGSNI